MITVKLITTPILLAATISLIHKVNAVPVAEVGHRPVPVLKELSPFGKTVEPGVNFGVHPSTFRDGWQEDKKKLKSAMEYAKATLESAAKSDTRPGVGKGYRLDSRGALKQYAKEVGGWRSLLKDRKEYGNLYDPEGRRQLSAKQDVDYAKDLYDGIHVLHTDHQRPWEEVRKTIARQIEMANAKRQEALAFKQHNYRHGYGEFVEKKAELKDVGNIPFVTSDEAHQKKEAEARKLAKKENRKAAKALKAAIYQNGI